MRGTGPATIVRTGLAAMLFVALLGCEEWLVPSVDFDDNRPQTSFRNRRNVTQPGFDAGPASRVLNDAGVDTGPPAPTSFQAALALGNLGDQPLVLRTRTLRQGLVVDCQAIAHLPHETLSEPAFGPSKTWVVPPGQTAPIAAVAVQGGSCRAVLLESSAFGSRLVFWDHSSYPTTSLSANADEVPEARLLRVSSKEGELIFGWHATLYPAPVTFGPAGPPCGLPGAASSIAWSEPEPVGPQTLIEAQTAPDGCLALQLKGNQGLQKWYLCLPDGAFPFATGDTFVAKKLTHGHMGIGQIRGLEFAGTDGAALLRVGLGEAVVHHGNTSAPVVKAQAGCPGEHDACGNHSVPLTMGLLGKAGKPELLVSGSAVEVDQGGTLYLVSARDMRVLDPACSAGSVPFMRRLETVYVAAP